MEGESILDVLYEEPLEFQDVDMVEAGECEEELLDIKATNADSDGVQVTGEEQQPDIKTVNGDTDTKQVSKRTGRRRKSKKGKKSSNPDADINRFVVNTCRRLKERKSYLVRAAVGCLGLSSISNLVKEVETIQRCGGQVTANGYRHRTGGGILWNILKSREPKAYKEIMAKGKEFEKQLKELNRSLLPKVKKESAAQESSQRLSDGFSGQVFDSSQPLEVQSEHIRCSTGKGRTSALSRIRAPVTYDDLFDEPSVDEAT